MCEFRNFTSAWKRDALSNVDPVTGYHHLEAEKKSITKLFFKLLNGLTK